MKGNTNTKLTALQSGKKSVSNYPSHLSLLSSNSTPLCLHLFGSPGGFLVSLSLSWEQDHVFQS